MELYLPPIPKKKNHDEKGRFVKGMTAWNKGMKMRSQNVGGCSRYKPGHLPHNAKHDYAISIRSHKKDKNKTYYIRLSVGVWKPLHHFNWEQVNGPMPENHIIRFKDGNKLNCDINNLECISKKENLMRNSNRAKMAKTLKETWNREKLRVAYGLQQQTKYKLK